MIQSIGQQNERVWRVHADGQDFGPYTWAELETYIASGQVGAGAMYKGPGMSEWQMVGGLAEPAAEVQYQAPVAYQPAHRAARHAPGYMGIRIGATVLMVFGVCAVAVGLFMLLAAFMVRTSSDPIASMEATNRVIVAAGLLGYGVMLCFIASIGEAIRDIAQNSFKR